MKKVLIIGVMIFIICILIFVIVLNLYNNRPDLVIKNNSSEDLYNVELIYNDSTYIEPYGDILAKETASFFYPSLFSEGNIWIKYENKSGDIIKSEIVGYFDTGFPQIRVIVKENNGKLTFKEKNWWI